MKLNTVPNPTVFTAEGAPAKRINPMQRLRRSVCSSLLWEREFYEDGEDIASRVLGLCDEVPLQELAALALEVRETHKLRHMPLLLLAALVGRGKGQVMVADAIAQTIQRADEMGELLAIWAKMKGVGPDRVKPLPAQMKKGLARAFLKFDRYQLAKYNRRAGVTLVDVMRLVRPKPLDDEQNQVFRELRAGNLAPPDTWEVALSGGADKAETFTRLLREHRLGYLALLRNLRSMVEAGVDRELVRDALIARRGAARVLPFRYVAAARACPQMEPTLDQALRAALGQQPVLSGQTIFLVDVSGSMTWDLSKRSDLSRLDAAATLASIMDGDRRVFTFSTRLVEVPPRLGMAGIDTIRNSQPQGGTMLGWAVSEVNKFPHDRLVVITDEQSHDRVPDPVARHAYLINVASNQNGVGYGRWTHIDGFSENVLRFIQELESQNREAS